jgi:hypothetical protein
MRRRTLTDHHPLQISTRVWWVLRILLFRDSYSYITGYGEAAVKLQRDWNLDPQSLPFANRIKSRALVSLVQQGLRYYYLAKTLDQARYESSAFLKFALLC